MIVSIPERMLYVRILVPKDIVDSALNILQELGAIHVEVIGKIPEEDKRKLLNDLKRIEELEKLITNIEAYVEIPKLVRVDEYIPPFKLKDKVVTLQKKLKEVANETNTLVHKLRTLEEKLSRYNLLLNVFTKLKDLYGLGDVYVDYFSYQGEVISSITLLGKLQGINELRSFIKRAKDKGLETYSIETYRLSEDLCICLIVADTLLINSIRTSIKRFNVEVIDIPQVHIKVVDFLKDLESKVRKLGEEVKYVKSRLREIIDRSLRDIALAKALIPLIKERLDVLLAALMGRYLVGIEGWVPQTQYYLVENTLHGKLRYVFISSVRSDKKPPTKMRNPKPIRMFELITKIYGIPNYNEWDPTPIIAYSLMIFFGLMFADFIYGLAMFVIVMFVLERLGLVENPYSEGYRMFKKLLIVLSISSMFFGILSNSFAGYSIVLVNGSVRFVLATGGLGVNALLPIMDPMFFIKLALIIGLVHINIAHALALLKFWRGKVKGEFISKVGFFVAEIFGIPYILYVFLGMELPPPFNYVADYLLYGAIGGLVLLILGKFMTYGGLAALFWLFDVTGLLGDVMSYTRLAGLGLATTLLAQNFNSLALGIASSLGSVVPLPMLGLILGVIASVIIIFLANMLNIAFGILGAFIHSLRLCFVEFLPKFYEGEGMEFKPFSMKLEKAVLVGMSR